MAAAAATEVTTVTTRRIVVRELTSETVEISIMGADVSNAPETLRRVAAFGGCDRAGKNEP